MGLSLYCFMLVSCDNPAVCNYQTENNTINQITNDYNIICDRYDEYSNDLPYSHYSFTTKKGYASENGIIAHSTEDIDDTISNDEIILSPMSN